MARINRLIYRAQALLDADETVLASVAGQYETTMLGSKGTRDAVLLATSKRLFLYAYKFFGYEIEVFPYSSVSSIEATKGLRGYSITLFASGNAAKVKWIYEGDPNTFVVYVRGRIGGNAALTAPSPTAAPNASTIPDQIRALATLRDQGLVTEQEFLTKRTELLARM